MSEPSTYVPRRTPRSDFVTVRGLRHHVLSWGDAAGHAASARRW